MPGIRAQDLDTQPATAAAAPSQPTIKLEDSRREYVGIVAIADFELPADQEALFLSRLAAHMRHAAGELLRAAEDGHAGTVRGAVVPADALDGDAYTRVHHGVFAND